MADASARESRVRTGLVGNLLLLATLTSSGTAPLGGGVQKAADGGGHTRRVAPVGRTVSD